MPIGVTASSALVFPLQCRELLARYGDAHPAAEARAELTPTAAEQANHEFDSGESTRDQEIVKFPSKRSEVDPMPRARVKPARSGDVASVFTNPE